MPGGDPHGHVRFGGQYSGIEGPVVGAGIHYVPRRCGRRLPAVAARFPAQLYRSPVFGKLSPERPYRQGLHHIRAAVELAQGLEYALVYGPAYREAERRVEGKLHVGEVLVAEQLEYHGRYTGGPAFAVAPVPQSPARPQGVVARAYVVHDLGLHIVAEQAAYYPVASVGELPVGVASEGVYGEGSHCRVALGDSRVGMEREREVERYLLLLTHHRGPQTACREVVGVVVLPVACGGAVGACPLHPVVRTFHETRDSGGASSSFQLAHSAAEPYGVCGDDFPFGAVVVERDGSVGALVELEGAEIYPCPAASALVDREHGLSSHVPYGVACLSGAFRQGLVGNIDGIAAPAFDFWHPGGRCVRQGVAGGHSRRTGAERVVAEAVGPLEIGKALSRIVPAALFIVMSGLAGKGVTETGERPVVVADDLKRLRVPFARSHYTGSGILQHGHQERQHEAGCEHVLYGMVQRSPLPYPFSGGFVVVFPVALPQGYVSSVETVGKGYGSDAVHERAGIPLSRVADRPGVSGRPAAVPDGGEYQVGEFVAVRIDPAQTAGGILFPYEPVHD